MRALLLLPFALGAAAPFPAPALTLAQVTAGDPAMAARGYADRAANSPEAEAEKARQGPATAGLNGQVAADHQDDQAARSQYEADRAAYLAALAQHDAAVDRTDARYARQQRAYADAMAAWRQQVQDCKHGHSKACDLPPPNVADYY